LPRVIINLDFVDYLNEHDHQNDTYFTQSEVMVLTLILCLFYARKQLLLSARLSHRNSVRLSVTRVDQSKTVQARIIKFSPSAAWKTLVSGTVKLFHKFKGGHPERGR